MDQNIATAEKEVLEELVKLVQRKGLRGENGGWNEFVDVYNKSIKSPNDDPSSSNDMMAAFLSTFKKKEDLKFLHYHANSLLVANFKKESPENDTPEQRLVRLTMKHPEYSVDYSFQSLFREDWFISDVGMKMLEVMKSTDMIAVDCEMVLCENGTEGLVRVGAVDRDLKVILHEFVKPDKRVVDYRTPVTGVTAEDIEKATLSVVDIQKVLQPFLSKGAILVGHSLNKDMKVLKIDHPKVIDTALAFKLSNARQSRKPSLNDLYMAIFGEEVRKLGIAHNCVHDAAATMKIALAFVEKRVDDTTITPSKELLEAVNSKFFLHRIPHNVTSEVLENVLARAFGSTEFKLEVKPAKSPGGYYCAIVVFDNSRKAEQAFENIAGYQDKDSYGLPQKQIVFQRSSGLTDNFFYIRKMG